MRIIRQFVLTKYVFKAETDIFYKDKNTTASEAIVTCCRTTYILKIRPIKSVNL